MTTASWLHSPALRNAALGLLALSALAAPTGAAAGWRGGVVFGVAPAPLYYPPPVYAPPLYVPPPVYYAPPPMVYAPPPFYVAPPSRHGQTCYAGPYTCPMDASVPAGSACSCPAHKGRAYGRAG